MFHEQSPFADSSIYNDESIDSNKNVFFPEKFSCILLGPSECRKTSLSKNLIKNKLYFHKLCIIGSTRNQHEDVGRVIKDANVDFSRDKKDLPSPDNYLKINVRDKELVFNE